jgi:hypothetical protein
MVRTWRRRLQLDYWVWSILGGHPFVGKCQRPAAAIARKSALAGSYLNGVDRRASYSFGRSSLAFLVGVGTCIVTIIR